MNDPINPKSSRLKGGLFLVLLSFLGGLAAMGWAVTNWEPARDLVFGSTAKATIPTGADRKAVSVVAPPPAVLRPSAADARIDALEARIDELQSSAGSRSSPARAEGLLIAFSARRAIDRGLALGYLEAALFQHFGATQPRSVGIVVATARQPVTIDRLKDSLIALGPKLTQGKGEVPLLTQLQDSLSSLIIVRKAGTPSSNPEARLARALTMVDSGRIDVALVEVARLPGATNATQWMRDARRLAETHRALDVLEASAIMQPGKAQQSASPPILPAPEKAQPVPPAAPSNDSI